MVRNQKPERPAMGHGEVAASAEHVRVDVLVMGTGAAGLSAAITAAHHGLDILIVEKEAVWGGSSAVSSGGIWAPLSSFAAKAGMIDNVEDVRRYLEATAPLRDPRLSERFLECAGPALDFLAAHSDAAFMAAPNYPDYDSERPGSSREGRMIWPVPFDASHMGQAFETLRRPLRHSMLFQGMMIGVPEFKTFLRAHRSPAAAWHVVKRVARYARDRLTASRGYQLSNGNALVARLGSTLLKRSVPIWLSTAVKSLLTTSDGVSGAIVERDGQRITVEARFGVIMAGGGAAASRQWREKMYPHVRSGAEHHSLVPPGATGDALNMALGLGADARLEPAQPVVWLPVSLVPVREGVVPFPSFIDRAKPGFIAVDPGGRRFANEASSYQEFVPNILAAAKAYGDDVGHAWLIADHDAVRRYGIGAARPFPFRLSPIFDRDMSLQVRPSRRLLRRSRCQPRS